MNIIELINLIKPLPELFIHEHDIFCLDAFFELFDTFYQEHISRDFFGKVEWLIITLEDENYDNLAHLLKEDLKYTTLGTELCMKLQSHLNTILRERGTYPRVHFSLVEELLKELNEKVTF